MAQVIRDPGLRLMLEAAHRRQMRHTARWTVGIAVLGVLNLFVCAYLERFLEAGAGGNGFLIFLMVESCLLALTISAVVAGELELIARKARVFPLTARGRFEFIFFALLRHRAVLMIAGTALFAVGAIGPSAPAAVIGRAVMVALLELLLLAGFATLTALRARPGASTSPVLLFLGLALAGIVITAIVASPGPVLQVVIPFRWVAEGAFAAQRGVYLGAGAYALRLVFSTVLCILIGRRYA